MCLPWHWGTFKTNPQGVTGDTANDLIAISGDPNVTIHESKAFRCSVRAGRRTGETTERLAGIETHEDPNTHHDPDVASDDAAQHARGRGPDLMEVAIQRPEAQRMGFFTDTTVCIGCKACEVACKQWNDLPADEHQPRLVLRQHAHAVGLDVAARALRRDAHDPRRAEPTLNLVEAALGAELDRWVFMSDVCKHCTNAGCLDACPTGALIRTEFETVIVQPDVCNGCGYCIPSCPFGVIDRDPFDGRAAKCTLCYDRLEDGLEPACAKACPTDSIQFGPYDELVERAKGRVATLAERGIEGAYLYGAGDGPGDDLAGGLGAFFLLTESPEVLRPARPGGLAEPAERPDRQRDRGGGVGRGHRRGAGLVRRGVPEAQVSRRKGPPPEDVTRRAEARPHARGPRHHARRGRARVRRRVGARGGEGRAREGELGRLALVVPLRQGHQVRGGGRRRRRGRGGARGARRRQVPVAVQGPMIHAAVWTWEVPVYFFVGGLAAGSALVAVACDSVGDHEAAALARKLALGAVIPAPALLIADLGRPARFFNMLRIFKPRSPMSMGSWCLVVFSTTASGAVAADLLGKPRMATAAGGVTAFFGTYLGSYTGALLAATATPLWARSRVLLAPIFVCTATASGAAANRLFQRRGPAREALGQIELIAMGSKLVLSALNDRHIGDLVRAAARAPHAQGLQLGRALQHRAPPAAPRRRPPERPVPGLRPHHPPRLGRGRQALRARRRSRRAHG